MNSKEALETLGNVEVAVTTIRSGTTHFKTLKEQYKTEFEVLERELFIKKELKDFDVYQERLEQLEKENQELKNELKRSQETINSWMENHKQLIIDNGKMKKALEKSCEMLEYTCPVEEELIDDLDCENCKDNYKECWKKFFLKEVLDDVKK